ncbi:DNA polymerase III subunit delta' [Naumannella halotolerans]|uniref:DNA polymerase-3 subunit delta n=1 Tax=Naumannella halotolerans TaxID=993414 RepID=A0A4R7J0S6_9ACTN|nr:DNA polymerase III subunit delta' [Naumannella halotolerans]TDT29907.1 DNA polymerase-3 subunit delta' [Naumannella halotolerans]
MSQVETAPFPVEPGSGGFGVWADLVGQGRAVDTLRRAVAGGPHAMSHAWLITGPPGSGRSNAARAFAAALECESADRTMAGCGECRGCRTALSGAHPDVTLVRTEMLSIGVDEIRDLVRRASMSPSVGRHQVLVIEDADRVTERGADALLKSIEEPSPRTVWLLCAPTPEDVVATIRSRSRALHLTTPQPAAVAELLQRRDGIPAEQAVAAARAAQGHIGRARVLARNPEARERRHAVLQIPGRLRSLGACLTAAEQLVTACSAESAQVTAELDVKEREELERALGVGTKGARSRSAQAALRELADQQKARAKRFERDALDRALTELTGYYRDVLNVQTGAAVEPINVELAEQIAAQASRSRPEATLRRIDALLACREALETNVRPLLAVEAMLVALVRADRPD